MSNDQQTNLFDNVDVKNLPAEVRNKIELDPSPDHPRRNALVTTEKITKDNLLKVLENTEALVSFYNKAEDLILKRTKNEDWMMIGNNPYPLESAVKKAHMTIGSKIVDIRVEQDRVTEQIQGGDFDVLYFTAYGRVCFNGQEAEAIGTASTKDKFFAERSREVKDSTGKVVMNGNYPAKEKYLLKLKDVEVMNVKKKAVTNLYKRALDLIFRLNPTVDKLKELGITPASGYDFAGGSQGGSTDTADEKEQRTKIKTLLAKISQDTGKSIGKILQNVTSFGTGEKAFKGYTDPARVSPKMLAKTITSLTKLSEKS